jgi:hypothetical protein
MTDDRNRRVDDDEQFAERIARPLRAPERASDAFEDSLIDAIRSGRPLRRVAPRRHRPLSPAWWSLPAVHLSPIAGLALAAGIAAAAVLVTRFTADRTTVAAPAAIATAPATAPDTVTFVRFVFVGPAESVSLVGDFNSWGGEPLALDETPSGAWTASVPLANGRHEYAFIVDGERWVADPLAPSSSDEFDTRSSVIMVGT